MFTVIFLTFYFYFQSMDLSKIIYIGITFLTALWFVFFYTPPPSLYNSIWETGVKNLLWLVCWIGGSAIFASWISYHWVHPDTWGRYLLCGLCCTLLFHVGLSIGVGLYGMITEPIEENPLKEIPMHFFTGLLMTCGAFVISILKVGIYTLWLCLQTALLTKGILWIIDKYK